MTETLETLVAKELSLSVDPRVTDLAKAIAKAHGKASRAVLFYGSCLREKQFEGMMLDFYLIVSDYRSAYARRWLRVANRLVPPNVFMFEAGGLAAKYAVLSEADFYRLNGPETRNVSVWARFAQPSRLVWAANQTARKKAIAAVARATPTLLASAILTVPDSDDPLDLWRGAFKLTYSAELRAERRGRSGKFVEFDPDRYLRFTEPAIRAIAAGNTKRAGGGWARRRIEGKLLTALRLAKASATFAGGVDYIAWKINRHAGTAIEIKPWQRRWPLLAAITLVPKLLRSGAVR
jgi:hypothetical protein